jgi:hypothetical protein
LIINNTVKSVAQNIQQQTTTAINAALAASNLHSENLFINLQAILSTLNFSSASYSHLPTLLKYSGGTAGGTPGSFGAPFKSQDAQDNNADNLKSSVGSEKGLDKEKNGKSPGSNGINGNKGENNENC